MALVDQLPCAVNSWYVGIESVAKIRRSGVWSWSWEMGVWSLNSLSLQRSSTVSYAHIARYTSHVACCTLHFTFGILQFTHGIRYSTFEVAAPPTTCVLQPHARTGRHTITIGSGGRSILTVQLALPRAIPQAQIVIHPLRCH